jgi:hypothetical protein
MPMTNEQMAQLKAAMTEIATRGASGSDLVQRASLALIIAAYLSQRFVGRDIPQDEIRPAMIDFARDIGFH